MFFGYNRKIGKYVSKSEGTTKIQEEEGRAGRKDIGITKQVVLERSKIGKSA